MSYANVEEILEHMEPEPRVVIRNMITREGLNGDIKPNDILKLPRKGRDEDMAILRFMGAEMQLNRNRFAPKLMFQQRCEVLALSEMGFPRETLAKIYNIDRRTVTHIFTEGSPHYKNVRKMQRDMGKERFRDFYIKHDILENALLRDSEYKDRNKPNKLAKGKVGIHVVRGANCEYDHRVIIGWREVGGDIEVAGWYYQDLDGDFPDKWFFVDEESRRTSMACYLAMLKDITDRLPGSTP